MKHMLKIWIAVMAFALPAAAQSSAELDALTDAINAGGRSDWQAVDEALEDISAPLARDIVEWTRLRGRQGSFADCREFIARNADWPGMKLLRKRCESAIPRGADRPQVFAYFKDQLPQTGIGSLRLAEALIGEGRSVEAAAELSRAWLSFTMSEDEHNAFIERNGLTVRDLHVARLDMLLWRDAQSDIKRMLPLVSEDHRKLATARTALRQDKTGVDDLIAAVPESLVGDPGLAYERFLWRARKGRSDAADIILARSISTEALGDPQAWSSRRRALARSLMREGKHAQAYSVASSHYLTKGSAFADLEWLSGFIALRYLNAPDQALQHFEVFEAAVATPISLGRAGYWTGRAHEALGNTDAAAKAYAFGAKYQSSFYGQLAAEQGGLPAHAAMTGKQTYPDWREADFNGDSVFEAARLLHRAGMRSLSERFFVHLAETQSRTEQGQLGDLALELEEPHIALMLAKEAARQGMQLYKTYFPIATPAGMQLPVDEVFALSIARRESEFDPVVVSPVGARGLMQLMPGTAREMATRTGEPYNLGRLRTDPSYNARLGSAYLASLAERYQNNPVLMSIAYNAGPTRADRWMRQFGDPRSASVDIIDWIENIPFTETRNYVMRVTESFMPYRARLTGQVQPPNLMADLRR